MPTAVLQELVNEAIVEDVDPRELKVLEVAERVERDQPALFAAGWGR
jgi:hypothetical protein